MASEADIKPTDLRSILKYVPRFQGQFFVIALDGSIVADDNIPNLLTDIVVLRSLGIKVVIVHGIGQQIVELAKLRNIAITDVFGTGASDGATLDLAIQASSSVTHLIIEGITANGLKAALTNAVRAMPLGIIKGVDHQFTGRVDRIDREFLQQLIGFGIVPVVNPIGLDRDGKPLRINSDLLAAALAEVLQATKIIYLTPHSGLEINGQLQRNIPVDVLRKLLESKPESINEPIRSKAVHAVKAVDTGPPRIHLIDGREPEILLAEIFSNEGIGTLIHGNEYQQIRKAVKRDVRAIYNLTHSGMKREELRQRSQQTIEKSIDQFYVFEIDENLIACISLTGYPESPKVTELGSLYVMPPYSNRGIGQKMVDFACLTARAQGAEIVIALSTQAYSFFTSVCGFEEAEKQVLPKSRLKSYEESGRNSKILMKKG